MVLPGEKVIKKFSKFIMQLINGQFAKKTLYFEFCIFCPYDLTLARHCLFLLGLIVSGCSNAIIIFVLICFKLGGFLYKSDTQLKSRGDWEYWKVVSWKRRRKRMNPSVDLVFLQPRERWVVGNNHMIWSSTGSCGVGFPRDAHNALQVYSGSISCIR